MTTRSQGGQFFETQKLSIGVSLFAPFAAVFWPPCVIHLLGLLTSFGASSLG